MPLQYIVVGAVKCVPVCAMPKSKGSNKPRKTSFVAKLKKDLRGKLKESSKAAAAFRRDLKALGVIRKKKCVRC